MDFLAPLAQGGMAFVALLGGIWYFFNKEKKYQEQIERLQEELRNNEKETLKIIQSLTATLDKVVDAEASTKSEIIRELRDLKETLVNKIESIKS